MFRFKQVLPLSALACLLVVGLILCSCGSTTPFNGDANSSEKVSIDTTGDGAPAGTEYNLAEMEQYADLPDDNVYHVANKEQMVKFVKHGTGIMFFAFRDCRACQLYIPLLDKIAKEHGVDKIVYYDLQDDRFAENETYSEVLELMKDYTDYSADGDERLFVPSVAFIDHGTVKFYNDDTSRLTDEEVEAYWTPERKEALANTLAEPLDEIGKAMKECAECG